MRPTIVLFDVDGTLVHTGGAGRRALAEAFGQVLGRSDVLDEIRLGGMTDPLILRAGFRAAGRSYDRGLADAVLDAYLALLPDAVAASRGYRVLPGAAEVVDALVGRRGFAIGLGTGNVRRGATAKLARGGLDGSFGFGGFGCDHEDRAELLRAGARRGARQLGIPLEGCRVVVVGDTPRDVEAAHAIGAECIAVATGSFGLADLARAGATSAFADLTTPRALAAIAAQPD